MVSYNEKANLLYKMDKIDEALEILNEAVTLKIQNEKTHLYLTRCYFKKRDSESALKNLDKCLAKNPEFCEGHFAAANLKNIIFKAENNMLKVFPGYFSGLAYYLCKFDDLPEDQVLNIEKYKEVLTNEDNSGTWIRNIQESQKL